MAGKEKGKHEKKRVVLVYSRINSKAKKGKQRLVDVVVGDMAQSDGLRR
jgi:hypothetical protein